MSRGIGRVVVRRDEVAQVGYEWQKAWDGLGEVLPYPLGTLVGFSLGTRRTPDHDDVLRDTSVWACLRPVMMPKHRVVFLGRRRDPFEPSVQLRNPIGNWRAADDSTSVLSRFLRPWLAQFAQSRPQRCVLSRRRLVCRGLRP